MARKSVAVLFALLLIGASAGAAQVSIGVGGQYLSLSGSDFDGVDAGIGVEGNVMVPVGSSLKVGGSGQWATHSLTGQSENLTSIGAFGEGRYMFSMAGGGKLTPYVGARGGWLRGSVSAGGQTGSASGFAGGGGVGVMFALSPGLALDINGMFHTVSLGEFKVDGTVVGPKSSGTALQIRGGVNFRLGG